MSTAFVIAMLAVAISLGVVVIAVRANNAKKPATKDGGDAGTTSTASTSSDCGPSDSGGCDGGGGGD